MRLVGLVLAFLAFTGWTLSIVAQLGFPALASLLSENGHAQQILVDLVIAVAVAWVWLVPDARALGMNPWPYVIATPVTGCIAVLAFLIHRELVLRRSVSGGASPAAAAR
ncbi:MAG: DUF2834 domain-containing protein [Myxococcaceae bacterium]|nr:DUF2834 domain-containing protein [Myxococcaceae bacterium]